MSLPAFLLYSIMLMLIIRILFFNFRICTNDAGAVWVVNVPSKQGQSKNDNQLQRITKLLFSTENVNFFYILDTQITFGSPHIVMQNGTINVTGGTLKFVMTYRRSVHPFLTISFTSTNGEWLQGCFFQGRNPWVFHASQHLQKGHGIFADYSFNFVFPL